MTQEIQTNKELDIATRFRSQKEQAEQCFNTAASQYARGFFLLYEIRTQETYRAEYEHWDDFLLDFSADVKDASRTLMYDMVRVIRRLKSLEDEAGKELWSDEDVLEALEHPTVVQDALVKCAEWERGGGFAGLANGVDIPFLPESAEAEVLTAIVKDAMALSRGEGRKYVSERAGEPQIYAILREMESGKGFASIEIVDGDTGDRFEFFCRELLSDAVRAYLERVFRARFKEVVPHG